MKQDISQLIKIEEEYIDHPEHMQWIADLQTAWEVALNEPNSGEIKWNTDIITSEDISRTFYYASARPSTELPGIGNRVFCVGSDGHALSSHLGAPILMSYQEHKRDILSDYKIRKVRGEESKEPIELSRLFSDMKLPENTPVYKTAFFLPVPREGANYETHFFPLLNSDTEAANFMIIEDNLIPVGQISHSGMGRKLMSIDKIGNESYIKAKYTPDAVRDGKIVLPEYEGRIIIMCVPVQVKNITATLYTGQEHDFRNWRKGDMKQKSLAYPTRGVQAEVSTVSLETGMQSKHRSTAVEAATDVTRSPVIYDIRCLGVRDAKTYTSDVLKSLFAMAYNAGI